MTRIVIIISLIFLNANLFSQITMDEVLMKVENNNTSLLALKKRAEAEMIGNKTGIFLQNPEIEFAYLWGSPEVIGSRTNFAISQTFDFPSSYRYKNQISEIRNEQVELEYQKERKLLRFQTKLVCIDLMYYNALQEELTKRLKNAQSIAEAYKLLYAEGETNAIEYNKTKLSLLQISKELESVDLEKEALLSDLSILNGGNRIGFNAAFFNTLKLTENFDEWYITAEENNPVLAWLKQNIEAGEKEEKLKRALGLPKIKAGYMSEKVIGQKYQGISVGLSIPIRENKNMVKYARANTAALESLQNDNKIHFYNHLKALYTKVSGQQENLMDYRLKMAQLDNYRLIEKALNEGHISLIDYIIEISIFYESIDKMLELERDMNITLANLNRFM